MKQIALLTTELTVDEVMRRWPPTIRAFLDFSMHCVGCPIAPFHTVEEACREHGVDLAVFFSHLQTAASSRVAVQSEVERRSPSARPNNA